MKRLMILGIIVCVGLLFSTTAVAKDPKGPPSGLGVEVVNPLPLPVMGDVNATVSGGVEVVNTPDVNVVNEPVVRARQDGTWSIQVEATGSIPVQKTKSTGIIDGLPNPSYSGTAILYEVPDGYRFIIEYVGFRISGVDLEVNEIQLHSISGASIEHTTFLNVPFITPPLSHGAGDEDSCTGGQMMKYYAEPRNRVGLYVVAFSPDHWQCYATMSGYLIPLD